MAKLPGITWATRPSLDRMRYQQEIIETELLERMKLVMGHPDYTTSTYGIVDDTPPTTATEGSDSPLTVATSVEDPLYIDVMPGTAVTPSGVWIKIDAPVRRVEVPDTTLGVPSVVYIRHFLDIADTELNDYLEAVIPYTIRPGEPGSLSPDSAYIEVTDIETFLELDEAAREDIVPLAIVTPQPSSGGGGPITLSFDFTQDSYSWNRPWFSAQDVQHRNLLGTGIQSAQNAHAISQNDLTIGTFTPLQLHLDHGMIIADDKSIAKVPGVWCSVKILGAALKQDNIDGKYTGYPEAFYAELPNYPVRLGRIWLDSDTDIDWAGHIVQGTNRVVFPFPPPDAGTPDAETIHVSYTKVEACEPPVGSEEINFSTNNPSEDELVIAGGSGLVQLGSTQEPFADAQRFPLFYDILVDGDGTLMKAPQIVYCYKRIADIGSTDTFSIELYGPARIMCGLAKATDQVGMSVEVTLYGKDEDGTPINHTFSFDRDNWDDIDGPPGEPTQSSTQVSDLVFAELDQIVVNNSNDGLNSAIMMWALIDPYDTYDDLKDACHVARVKWNGYALIDIMDKRIIGTTVLKDSLGTGVEAESLGYVMNALAGGNANLFMEDFRNPKLHNLVTVPGDMSKLSVGMQGFYETRGLPVGLPTPQGPPPTPPAGPTTWRMILTPINPIKKPDFLPDTPWTFYYYFNGSWTSTVFQPVPGLLNTFEATTEGPPDMVRVRINPGEYTGMVLVG